MAGAGGGSRAADGLTGRDLAADGRAGDTLFAPITGIGRTAVTAFRLSGPAAGPALDALSGRPRPSPRRAALRWLHMPGSGVPIDQALVLWMPGPDSFTGEDVVELHVHGGRAVAAALSDALMALPGMTPAEPGAFSRRAFDNGRMDVTVAEGIADLVAAETEAQRRQALRQMDGALGRRVRDWAERLTQAVAHLEAAIDFVDEDLPPDLPSGVTAALGDLAVEMRGALAGAGAAVRLRDGLSVVLVGPPNVGKSSLMNALAARDVAIVAERAGTTRDVVEAQLDLAGWPVILADTAGLRACAEAVEAEGVRRARARAAAADVQVLVLAATELSSVPPDLTALVAEADLVVVNKCDLTEVRPLTGWGDGLVVAVSAATGAGLSQLISALAALAAERCDAGAGLVTRQRHVAALTDAVAALERARAEMGTGALELVAHEARMALGALGRLTGAVDVEALLDVIFGDFCIGK